MYLFFRFCFGKPLLHNLKNFFVVRHFIYVILYTLCFLPNKLNEFLVMFGNKHEIISLDVGIIINIFMGFIMFLVRVSETNFYYELFCFAKKKAKRKSSNLIDLGRTISINENIINTTYNSEKDEDDAFFDKDQPLTAIISRNMQKLHLIEVRLLTHF
jgi:hypothetical protein